jgi:hypothetical protein
MPFEAALADLQMSPVYQRIAEEVLHLLQPRMNSNRIAVALKVDRTTVVRALRWIKDKSTYPDQRHIGP